MVSQALLDFGCEELEQDMGTWLSKQAHGHERCVCGLVIILLFDVTRFFA